MENIISVKDVTFFYPGEETATLKNVSLDVYKGEWLSIVGHNGSGKSTLAKLLNGLLLPHEGTVNVSDYVTSREDDIWEIRRQVGMVFQNPDNQFVGTSVKDDIAFGLENFGVPRDEMIKRINESVQRVGMEAFLDQEPHQLSGGQKQRVAIAGILAQKPSVIVLDEATSMLDPIGRIEVMETVRELNQNEGITVISITHDLEEALSADRVVVMKMGEKAAEGVPDAIFQQRDLLKSAGLDLPFSLKLSEALRRQGVELDRGYLTQEELVDALWKLA
ncbi:energy-coupling factor ABC transporter ATP-binding protein [Fictibacillus phosphorivorans]|uniref:energy-coupling factor ABC transporter ATP-binding protein n=1 Tax=Fictibacillus phosphorivorans TaxID=1221500 RepID=UPI002041A918|nr:energy-coupling factor ABC transporter ATP-binding protein [Fictibacillus phosphorivorans]MCM3719782.1 energy-coupling factor ABC transporter ATP-binding protein [Fictibacillus phosphorivorans]MCM3777420.1 energy-coupling factor ABC transporter ATP-binding protein [Fictibacillus phosphorivorans]